VGIDCYIDMKIVDKIKLFADGADLLALQTMIDRYGVCGFTTNPSLMKKAAVTDYESFARQFASFIHPLPVSFEVFADDFSEMEAQARVIKTWGENIYVKIPVLMGLK